MADPRLQQVGHVASTDPCEKFVLMISIFGKFFGLSTVFCFDLAVYIVIVLEYPWNVRSAVLILHFWMCAVFFYCSVYGCECDFIRAMCSMVRPVATVQYTGGPLNQL